MSVDKARPGLPGAEAVGDDRAPETTRLGARSDSRKPPPSSGGVHRYGDGPDPCPVQALGFNGGTYFFLSPRGEFRTMTTRDLFARGGVASLFGGDLDWLERQHPEIGKGGEWTGRVDYQGAAEDLIRLCDAAGFFDGATMRGPGVWKGRGGALLIHCGDRIGVVETWPAAPSPGADAPSPELRWQAPGIRVGGVIYRLQGAAEPPATVEGEASSNGAGEEEGPRAQLIRLAPASADDGRLLEERFGLWRFRDGMAAARLAMGFAASSVLGQASPWRSNVFVIAAPGSGKSWLTQLVEAVLGGSARPPITDFTEAYIRQSITGESRALVLDEAESDANPRRVLAVLELIRRATGGDRGATGGRGSTSGRAHDYDIVAPAWLSAVMHDPLRPQDASRFTRLRLDALHNAKADDEGEARAAIELSAAQSPAFRARMLALFPVWQENRRRARQWIMERKGGSSRLADQLGALIAGFWTLTGDGPADGDDLRDVAQRGPFVVAESSGEDRDAEDCLAHLLSVGASVWRSGRMETIGQLLAAGRLRHNVEQRAALAACGLRLVPNVELQRRHRQGKGEPGSDAAAWYAAAEAARGEASWRDPVGGEADWGGAWLAIANHHAGLAHAFADKPHWNNGKWAEVLDRLTGARPIPPLSYGGSKQRGVLIPPFHLPEDGDAGTVPADG